MNGVAAIYQLMSTDAALLALVPEEQIATGDLPVGTPLPALLIEDISSVDLEEIAPGAERFTSERVQVTVMAGNYETLVAVLKAVKSAGDAKYPTVDDLENVVVRTIGQGPYFRDDAASIHMRTQDFRVSFTQAA
jgi:hypothetical protein